MKYEVPMSGNYQVSCRFVVNEPTGKMIEVANPNRKWWSFWRPKFVTVPEMKPRDLAAHQAIIPASVGESIGVVVDTSRIGSVFLGTKSDVK